MTTSRRSRRWCFTINNPSEQDDPNLFPYRYMVWQKEEGSNGTPHLQGFVCFHQSKCLTDVRLMNARAHWEIARGTLEQNYKYCTKDEGQLAGPWIRGRKPSPGKRSDLTDVTDMIISGQKMKTVALSYPNSYVQYHRGLHALQTQIRKTTRDAPKIYIFHGPSGVGKTKLLYEVYPDAFWKPKGKWWDGYDGEHVVVIDEYYGWLSLDLLLRLLDRYPLLVEGKSMTGGIRMLAEVFVFTSNVEPRDWYRNLPVQRTDALMRRIKEYGEVYTKETREEEFVQDLTYN